jgi:gamma-glutamyltranspeptidase
LTKYELPPHQDEVSDLTSIEAPDDDGVVEPVPMVKHSHCHVGCSSIALLLVVLMGLFLYPPHTQLVYTGDNTPMRDRLDKLKKLSTVSDVANGAVAADHPACSEIGLSMMRDHQGNAVDAAVATALCLGVANPASSGIGGGAFILIHMDPRDNSRPAVPLPPFHDARTPQSSPSSSSKITEVIDCREVAGQAASTLMFEQEDTPHYATLYGGLAVAVPGELKGLELAHARHGRLEWATVVKPAMELAQNGVPVYEHLAEDIVTTQQKQDRHGGFPTLRKLLTHNDNWNHVLKQGQLLKNHKLAETLAAVMQQGSDAVYKGERAQQLAQEIQAAGGILTQQDLEQYAPTIRSPVISDNVFGFHIVGVPPPSSGGAVIVGALRFLKGYAEPLATLADTLSVHRMVEALKHVFSIRMSLADPAFPFHNNVTNATTQDAVEALISGSHMENLRRITKDNAILNLSQYGGDKFAQLSDADGQAEAEDGKEGDRRQRQIRRRRLLDPFGYLQDQGTSHLSVVDKDGNAVAITTSVNARFGACLVSESTGILLNNQMDGKRVVFVFEIWTFLNCYFFLILLYAFTSRLCQSRKGKLLWHGPCRSKLHQTR